MIPSGCVLGNTRDANFWYATDRCGGWRRKTFDLTPCNSTSTIIPDGAEHSAYSSFYWSNGMWLSSSVSKNLDGTLFHWFQLIMGFIGFMCFLIERSEHYMNSVHLMESLSKNCSGTDHQSLKGYWWIGVLITNALLFVLLLTKDVAVWVFRVSTTVL